MKQKMKQRTRRKFIVLLLALCVCMLFGALMLNNNFSAISASADSTAASIDKSEFYKG